ncbi:MAG: polysaccharide deacetylase family protein [Bacteroidetes bacterium]|nr:polysaccharide deacetylase family protein [Bacteroidota bacterium]
MHFFSVPRILRSLVSGCTWEKSGSQKIIYLSFDDGPTPKITSLILELLAQFNAKATFFCVGENLQRYPEMAAQIVLGGHTLGNHTLRHSKGWNTPVEIYIDEVDQTQVIIDRIQPNAPKLFRPPYGRITPKQITEITKRGYEIVLWSELSCDYDPNVNIQKSIGALSKNSKSGSIVVFHDSEKAAAQVLQILPAYLQKMSESGFGFNCLA